MSNKQYDRKASKARSVIDSHLSVMYRVATWRDKKERELEVLQAENKRLRKSLGLVGEFIEMSEDKFEELLKTVCGPCSIVAMKPVAKPKLGLVRFHVGGVTEIADMRIKG